MKRFLLYVSLTLSAIGLVNCQYVPVNEWLHFQPKDKVITQSVFQALKNSPDTAPFTFHIETAERVVYLSGYVKTIRQSDIAGEIAQNVSGVKSVENNVIVRK